MKQIVKIALAFLTGSVASLTWSCSGSSAVQSAPATSRLMTATSPLETTLSSRLPQRIKHVVIIVQENRTPDNLFNGFPGADTSPTGRTHDNRVVALQPVSFVDPNDITHSHPRWYMQWNHGQMNGFDLTAPPETPPTFPYAYVPRSETKPYWQLAQSYTFADRMFQSNSGPSYAAHQYLIAGFSQEVSDNPNGYPWGCDAPPGTTAALVGPNGRVEPGPFPCYNYQTLGDVMDAHQMTWRYYAPSIHTPETGKIWSAYDAISHIRFGLDWSRNVISPETRVLQDIRGGTLAQLTWVVPSLTNSDHATSESTSGPQWVGNIVNAIGEGPFWDNTAIFIVWDDWGGWYDHVPPPQVDEMGLGFRVPLIVVSPYAKEGYVSHRQHEFGSILHFVETAFSLPSLGRADARADDLLDCFNFAQRPLPFTHVRVMLGPDHFMNSVAPGRPPDD